MTGKKISFVGKILVIGRSMGVTIPKRILTVLALKKGQYIECSIKEVETTKGKEYKCPVCEGELTWEQSKEKLVCHKLGCGEEYTYPELKRIREFGSTEIENKKKVWKETYEDEWLYREAKREKKEEKTPSEIAEIHKKEKELEDLEEKSIDELVDELTK